MMNLEVVLVSFMLATYSAYKTMEWSSLTTIFLQEMVHVQRWHNIIIVNCNNSLGSMHELLQLQKNLGSSVYMQLLLSEDEDPVLLKSFSSVTPIIILSPCTLTSRIFTKVNENKILFSWWLLIMEDDTAANNFSSYFKDLLISTSDTNLVMFKQEDQEVVVKIYDIYLEQNGNTLHTQQVAYWAYQMSNRSLHWTSSQAVSNFSTQTDKMYLRSRYLSNTTLRVGVLVGKPDYSYDCGIKEDKLGHVLEINGFSFLLLQVLQNILHFRITYVESDTWGQRDNKGEWVGLIGLLVENKADIVVCSSTITAERSSAVQFLHPTQYSRRMLIYRATALPLSQDVFLLTFTGSLWLVCLLVTLALLAGFLHLTSYCNSKYQSEHPWTWVEVTLWAVAATCQQGCTKEPQGASSRAVFIVGYLTCYLLYTWFAAGVTSLLAVQGRDTHLQLEDVIQLDAHLTVYWDGLLSYYFMETKDKTVGKLYRTQLTKEYNKVHNMETLFSQLRKDGRVAMATEAPLQHYISSQLSTEEACQLTLSPLSGTRHMKGWAVQKNFSYFNIFNYWLLRMQETGVYEAALRRSIGMLPVCGSGPRYSSAGLGHVMSALCILAAGAIAALLILFLEIIWHCYKHQH